MLLHGHISFTRLPAAHSLSSCPSSLIFSGDLGLGMDFSMLCKCSGAVTCGVHNSRQLLTCLCMKELPLANWAFRKQQLSLQGGTCVRQACKRHVNYLL